jgi:hypothetical protein
MRFLISFFALLSGLMVLVLHVVEAKRHSHLRRSSLADRFPLAAKFSHHELLTPEQDHLERQYFNATLAKIFPRTGDPIFEEPDASNPHDLATLNGPMMRSNLEPDHCLEKQQVRRAMKEALQLARAALDYLRDYGKEGPSY